MHQDTNTNSRFDKLRVNCNTREFFLYYNSKPAFICLFPAYTYLLSYLLIYLLTPWSRVLLEKLTGSQLVKKLPAMYGTRRFITAFTSARHLSLSCANLIQSMPPTPYFLRIHLNIILPSTPGSSKCSLSLKLPHQSPVYASPPPIRATCPAHLILLDFITRNILREEYRPLSYSLCSFLHST